MSERTMAYGDALDGALERINTLDAENALLRASHQRLVDALEKIKRWGPFPATGKSWPDGKPISFGIQYGSNGERDYMREIARAALAAAQEIAK